MSQPLGCGTWINHKWEVLRPRRSRIAALFARAGAHTSLPCLLKCLQARSFVYRARHHNSKQALNPQSTLFASLRLLRSNPSERVVFVVVRIAVRPYLGTGLFVDAFVLNCAKSPQLSNARCLPVPKMPKGPPAPGRGEWDGVSPRRFRLKTVLHISYKSALVRVTWCWQRGGFWNNPSRRSVCIIEPLRFEMGSFVGELVRDSFLLLLLPGWLRQFCSQLSLNDIIT